MTSADSFRILTALACDEVRREDNGKLLAIGIYGLHVRFAQLPSAGLFSFICIADATEVGDFPLDFRATRDGEEVYITKNGKVSIGDVGRTLITVANIIVEVTKPTTLVLEYNYRNRGWETILELPIIATKQPTTVSATASPPPSEQSPSAAPASS